MKRAMPWKLHYGVVLTLMVGIACVLGCGSGDAAPTPTEVYAYLSQWGSQGNNDGQFNIIGGIAHISNAVYVSDSVGGLASRIQIFDSDGVWQLSHVDWSPAPCRGATGGIDVDGLGTMYTSVVDCFQILSANIQAIITWTRNDFAPPRAQFKPTDFAINSQGNVYVTEAVLLHQGDVFDNTGNYVTKWGNQGSGDGQFEFPWGVAVGPNDHVYVADMLNHRVQKFDSNGTFITKWGSQGASNGQFSSPRGVDVDGNGNVYVADSINHRVQKFDSNGTFIAVWGSAGNGNGEFSFPTDVAVSDDGTVVYVVDSLNYRVQKFELTP